MWDEIPPFCPSFESWCRLFFGMPAEGTVCRLLQENSHGARFLRLWLYLSCSRWRTRSFRKVVFLINHGALLITHMILYCVVSRSIIKHWSHGPYCDCISYNIILYNVYTRCFQIHLPKWNCDDSTYDFTTESLHGCLL